MQLRIHGNYVLQLQATEAKYADRRCLWLRPKGRNKQFD